MKPWGRFRKGFRGRSKPHEGSTLRLQRWSPMSPSGLFIAVEARWEEAREYRTSNIQHRISNVPNQPRMTERRASAGSLGCQSFGHQMNSRRDRWARRNSSDNQTDHRFAG
jgi:hypothetical protein